MKSKENSARTTANAFLDAYLNRRQLDEIMTFLAANIHWVGTGIDEIALGFDNVKALIAKELKVEPSSYDYIIKRVDERVLASGDVMFLMVICLYRGITALDTRITLLCTLEDQTWKVASVHGSIAAFEQKEGTYFPASDLQVDDGGFAHQVSVKTLDLLEKSIPGGILGVYIEPDFPIYYINNRIWRFLGYESYEQFMEETKGLFINCIPPEDRSGTMKMVKDASEKNHEYEIQYRICKRDGGILWVTDVGRQGRTQDGRMLCISVLRDITIEKERQRQLEAEVRETARQARRYNQLFQSVLCGIVQYHLDENHRVLFENANLEAIRIFGYTPDEFWAKTDWELPSLIAEEDRERVLQEVGILDKVGDKGFYEYRLKQKDGSPCWIVGTAEIMLNEQGKTTVQSVFIDINKRKQAERRNRLLVEQVEASNELLQLALEHTATCECYYYPRQGLLRLPKRAQTFFQTGEEYVNIPEGFALEHVEPEFQRDFIEMFAQLDNGIKTATLDFRLQDADVWCRATFSVLQYDSAGRSDLVVGVLEDITHEKNMEFELEKAHSRDPLTGLYNKEVGIRLIQESLQNRPDGDCYALMMLDMDNFSLVNNEEGEAFADALLQEVADILVTAVGEHGYAVRLGGDEFMLLIHHCTKKRATVIGPSIVEQVKNILIQPDQKAQISVSIGMCVTDVVENYAALYRCAEATLRYVKEHGRGTAACYIDTSNELGVMLTQLYTDRHEVNVIDSTATAHEDDLVSFALDLLGKSKNIDDAIFLLCSRIGKSLKLDRVSIVDFNREYLSCRYSYQWARDRRHLEIGHEFYLSPDELKQVEAMYDGEGLCDHFVRDDISSIASCLHVGIWNYGEFAGSISFEIDIPHYHWSEHQRKLLKELGKIVASFLMKVRADEISKAKTSFLSRMSHEIRTPMNAISGMTTIAKSVIDDKQKALDCLEKIESANNYLLELINDILDMSRIESGKMELNLEVMDLAEQLRRLEALLWTPAQGKGLTLQFVNNYRDNTPLMADTLHLNQVLINIIGNAIKFTPEGGQVIVRVDQQESTTDACLRFSVRDTGIGITEANRKIIFNAFEQGDQSASNYGGTGLGLAIANRLVQLMGGQLDVTSTLGKGSEFFFTIHLAYAPQEDPSTEVVEEVQVANHKLRGRRILIAEDNELNLEIVKTLLEMHGFRTVCAKDGQEALDTFLAHPSGYFDAILMDIRMPRMDGLEATRAIRTSDHPDARNLTIIALTANAFDDDSRKSIASGMNGHLSKPLQIEQLLALLSKCLGQAYE